MDMTVVQMTPVVICIMSFFQITKKTNMIVHNLQDNTIYYTEDRNKKGARMWRS